MTVLCNVIGEKELMFLLCVELTVGCVGEILCCVVVGSVSTISLFTKSKGVACCVRFVVPFRVSCLFTIVELKLLLLALSLNIVI